MVDYNSHKNINIQKPFLKWVGGKTQIINNILKHIPDEMENYHEIFLGGGSVLFAVLSLQKQKLITIHNKIYAYDLNESLINVYKNIQYGKDEVFNFITKYITEYNSIKGTTINRKPKSLTEAKTSQESYYYWVRQLYNNSNKDSFESSAIFMFLNKTCFRGMYREGPNGFNVPFGHYKKTPTIISKIDLDTISELIKDVEFTCSDFSSSLMNIENKDFVYLDPPYAPENTNSFVGYTSNGFNLEKHIELFNIIMGMDNKFAMSNAKVDIVTELFGNYNCDDIIARRAINSKNPGAKTTEVIIYN